MYECRMIYTSMNECICVIYAHILIVEKNDNIYLRNTT
jgi:hypothetical protein